MKKYEEMSIEEIKEICRRGGDDKRKLNHEVHEYLDGLKLSQRAQDVIACTDSQSIAETFGGLFTAGDVEEYIAENFPEEE